MVTIDKNISNFLVMYYSTHLNLYTTKNYYTYIAIKYNGIGSPILSLFISSLIPH